MNIQQLAAEKAREKYPEVNGKELPRTSEINTACKEAWKECTEFILNHLAGSEGDVDNLLSDLDSCIIRYGSGEPTGDYDTDKAIQFINQHTATHCAKVLQENERLINLFKNIGGIEAWIEDEEMRKLMRKTFNDAITPPINQ